MSFSVKILDKRIQPEVARFQKPMECIIKGTPEVEARIAILSQRYEQGLDLWTGNALSFEIAKNTEKIRKQTEQGQKNQLIF